MRQKNLLADFDEHPLHLKQGVPWEVAPIVFFMAISVYSLTGGFTQVPALAECRTTLTVFSQFLLSTVMNL